VRATAERAAGSQRGVWNPYYRSRSERADREEQSGSEVTITYLFGRNDSDGGFRGEVDVRLVLVALDRPPESLEDAHGC